MIGTKSVLQVGKLLIKVFPGPSFHFLARLKYCDNINFICSLGALALELDIWTTQSSNRDVVLHAGSRLEVSIEKSN